MHDLRLFIYCDIVEVKFAFLSRLISNSIYSILIARYCISGGTFYRNKRIASIFLGQKCIFICYTEIHYILNIIKSNFLNQLLILVNTLQNF
jgi:hypothetical protein